MQTSYPVQFDVDVPTRPLDRFTSFFRIFAAFPILALVRILTGDVLDRKHQMSVTVASVAGLLFLPLLLMILFRRDELGDDGPALNRGKAVVAPRLEGA